jgi:integrase
MLTFSELTGLYLHGFLRPRATYPYYCRLQKQFFSEWTTHRTKREIRDWHRAQSATPAHANKGLGFLRAMYNWAINEELWDTENPAMGIRGHATFDRERTLTHAELVLYMNSLDCVFWKFRILSLVLLTTGCRLGEACTMEWTHVDLQARSWTKLRTKNGRPHRIPLPRQTCEALDAIPRTGRFVFTGVYGRALSGDAVEKMWGILRRETWSAGEKWPALRMPDVRLHDFRRTVASRLLEQGESILIIKSILNHHKKDDVTGVYARPSFDRQALALQRHADGLWALLKEVNHDTQSLLPFVLLDGVRPPALA